MRLALKGGFYATRSSIANSQQCVNYYPEKNPESSKSPWPTTHYQRPGLVPITWPLTPGAGRGMWVAGKYKEIWGVVGNQVYRIEPPDSPGGWGFLAPQGPTLPAVTFPNPMCSFADAFNIGLLTDGSNNSYRINLTAKSFRVNADSNDGSYTGANRLDYIDGYVLYANVGTRRWGCTQQVGDGDALFTFVSTLTGQKNSWADNISSIYVNHHFIYIFGYQRSEVWYNAGNAVFPFQQIPGIYIEHGCMAPLSPSHYDKNVCFLSESQHGMAQVLRQNGYNTHRISNHAIEFALRNIWIGSGTTLGTTLRDAIGFTYQIDGHPQYNLSFPTADVNYTYDHSCEEWWQNLYTDQSGVLHQPQINSVVSAANTDTGVTAGELQIPALWSNGVFDIGMDRQTGAIYKLDPTVYTDTIVSSTGGWPTQITTPITCIRTFPHILDGEFNFGRPGFDAPVIADGRRIKIKRFHLDMEAAAASGNITLNISYDRGNSFTSQLLQATTPGNFQTQPSWMGVGVARDMVFQISHSLNGPAALNGAWIDADVLAP